MTSKKGSCVHANLQNQPTPELSKKCGIRGGQRAQKRAYFIGCTGMLPLTSKGFSWPLPAPLPPPYEDGWWCPGKKTHFLHNQSKRSWLKGQRDCSLTPDLSVAKGFRGGLQNLHNLKILTTFTVKKYIQMIVLVKDSNHWKYLTSNFRHYCTPRSTIQWNRTSNTHLHSIMRPRCNFWH